MRKNASFPAGTTCPVLEWKGRSGALEKHPSCRGRRLRVRARRAAAALTYISRALSLSISRACTHPRVAVRALHVPHTMRRVSQIWCGGLSALFRAAQTASVPTASATAWLSSVVRCLFVSVL